MHTTASQTPRLASLAALMALAGAVTATLAPSAAQGQLRSQFAAAAAPSARQNTPLVTAELRPGWVTESGTRMAALHLRLADGWKTYWRIPGEAGIVPRLDFSGSQNLEGVRLHWPRPVVFDQAGFRSIGYVGELVLPLELTPRRAGRPIALAAEINIGICDDICVPVDLNLSAGFRGPGAHDPLIAQALATVAQPAVAAGLSDARCRLAPGARGTELTLRATLPDQGRDEVLILELPGSDYWVSDNRSWREGGDLLAQARVRAPGGAAVMVDRSRVGFTVLSADRMLEHHGCAGE